MLEERRSGVTGGRSSLEISWQRVEPHGLLRRTAHVTSIPAPRWSGHLPTGGWQALTEFETELHWSFTEWRACEREGIAGERKDPFGTA